MTRDSAIGEVVRRLVEHYRPERIYLMARRAWRGPPDSDLDFVIVLPTTLPAEAFFDGKIYQRLLGHPAGRGHHSVSPQDLRRAFRLAHVAAGHRTA